jgi:hypothetical protein
MTENSEDSTHADDSVELALLQEGEVAIVVDPEGVLVEGHSDDVEAYIRRIQEGSDQATVVTDLAAGKLFNAAGIAAGAGSIAANSAKFVRLSPDSVKALAAGKRIPGTNGYFRMMTRGADGKFVRQLQWKSTSINPQRLMSIQMITVQMALTSAIAQVEDSVRRVEGKVEALLQLAEASRAGDIIGHNAAVNRTVNYLKKNNVIPDAMWDSVAGLGPTLAGAVEKLRNHVTRCIASLDPSLPVKDRAELLHRTVEDSKLQETLDLLVIAEETLYKWQSVLVVRVGTTEPEHLAEVINDSRELMTGQLAEDGRIYQQAKAAIDSFARTEDIDGFRFFSAQKLARDRQSLRKAFDNFARARRHQLETWEDFEVPDPLDAASAAADKMLDVASAATDKMIESTSRVVSGAGERLLKAGDLLAERQRRREVIRKMRSPREGSSDHQSESDTD